MSLHIHLDTTTRHHLVRGSSPSLRFSLLYGSLVGKGVVDVAVLSVVKSSFTSLYDLEIRL